VPTGDDAAFERLFALYDARVRLVAWRMCRRGDLVDDLTGEAWCRAYAARASYQPERGFLAWVCGILQNVWREHARSNAAEGQKRGIVRDDEAALAEESPDEMAAQAEFLAALNECVESLTPAERDLVRWRFMESQTLRAIAQRMGIAEATVRENRLPAALAKLERCLRKKGLTRIAGHEPAP